MPQGDGTLLMEDARLAFKNFAGKEGMYNAEGDRNFCVLLDDDLAKALEDDGWNVKHLRAREDGETPQAYIQVSLKYRGKAGAMVRPPTVVMITSRGRNNIPEDLLDMLDYADIATVDLIIRPYEWSVNGKSGVKAYLKSIYVTIAEDALALKYADVKEIGTGSDEEEVWDAEVVDEDALAIEA